MQSKKSFNCVVMFWNCCAYTLLFILLFFCHIILTGFSTPIYSIICFPCFLERVIDTYLFSYLFAMFSRQGSRQLFILLFVCHVFLTGFSTTIYSIICLPCFLDRVLHTYSSWSLLIWLRSTSCFEAVC